MCSSFITKIQVQGKVDEGLVMQSWNNHIAVQLQKVSPQKTKVSISLNTINTQFLDRLFCVSWKTEWKDIKETE